MRKLNYLYALALTPLLLGAGAGSTSDALTVDKLPSCGADQYLVYRSGGLSCSTVSGGGRTMWPDCSKDAANPLLTFKGGEVSSLSCTSRGRTGTPVNLTTLQTVENNATTLGTLVTQIEANPPAAGLGRYKGMTTTLMTGHIKNKADTTLGMGVLDNGLLAAAKFCDKEVAAGSHMCTVAEIYNSTINGALIRTALMAEKAWIYNVSMANPLSGTVQSGLNDNCAGYSYETADAKWAGTTVQWRQAQTSVTGKGDIAPNFYFEGCNESRKIACCL